ncbi:DUF386 domain-containing protein [Rasiella rasia]|uniref:DUF386 domain-containing protein n=1 Tax=Rasiella rasia TaxID=2744027 RepID=A0A6G6GK71_9FLAO|nr:YhcH/YjgK/YiaL family protein [Rasiella rasia]QIE58975.1 DUF386 domain-containing protein [Rasiella rasia]
MVLDTLKNCDTYSKLHHRMEAAFQFLQKEDLQQIDEGTYEIDGKDCFAIVMAYTTKPKESGFSEAHYKYIDIHYTISGSEKVGVATLEKQQPTEVNKEKDYAFYNCKTQDFILPEGSFMVLFPQDIHQTGIQIEGPKSLKKVVVKVNVQ